jgi:hypothetical protein
MVCSTSLLKSHAIASVISFLGHRHLSAALIIILIIFAVTTITSG